jgi:hypothetical protein
LPDDSPYSKPPPPPPPPPGPGALPKKKPAASPEMFEKLSSTANSLAANLRILEERYSLMRSKSQLSEQSMIDLEKSVTKDINSLANELTDLKHEVNDLMDKLRLISEELKNLVEKDEFRVLEKYVDMWQPMNFVTRNELMKLLEQKSKELQDKKA